MTGQTKERKYLEFSQQISDRGQGVKGKENLSGVV